MGKPLSELLVGLPCRVNGPDDVLIEDIVFDSRSVRPGALFAAFRGARQDARQFVAAARQSGARAVLSDAPVEMAGLTLVQCDDLTAALAHVSQIFWEFPSKRLLTVGITGTNGKTTTSYLVESIFQAAGLKPGVLGTINYRFNGQAVPAPNTTPFPSDIQRFMAQVTEEGGKACVMEVSSHALALGRVKGIDFDVAIFTNLTQDHLDFHKTMPDYRAAKRQLFEMIDPQSQKKYAKQVVINFDDPAAGDMASASRVPVVRYRLNGPADVFARHIQSDAAGSRFELVSPQGACAIHLPLVGDYNISNAIAAAATALGQSISMDHVRQGLESLTGVPGRMERIASPNGFSVVVDYAHTDDALRHVLEALRRLKPERLITVFGCGGDRDRTKRPLMGEAAATLSDEVIVTSDNPRSEDPGRITLDIEVGIRRIRSTNYEIILDRAEAIGRGLQAARPGDIVLVAGKGHENYQIVGSQILPFDDREVVRRLMMKPAPAS